MYSSLVSLLVLLQPPLRELPDLMIFVYSYFDFCVDHLSAMLPQLRTLLNIWYLQASNCNDHHGSAEQGQVCHLIERYASVKQGHKLSDPMCAHCRLQRPHKKLITGHDGGL